MKHEDLFNIYQHTLDWIDRRMTPETAKFYGENLESWKHAKEIAFNMYQDMRGYCEDGYPHNHEVITIEGIEKYGPYELDNDYKCAVVGVLRYRGLELPVYCDDYGMCDFIVYDGKTIEVDSFGGPTDWYYVLDKYIDKIYN